LYKINNTQLLALCTKTLYYQSSQINNTQLLITLSSIFHKEILQVYYFTSNTSHRNIHRWLITLLARNAQFNSSNSTLRSATHTGNLYHLAWALQ